MRPASMRLRQRDGITCGPAVATVAGAVLDPARRARLSQPDGEAWFAGEQGRIHASVNRVWPRRLGTTPAGMARALTDLGAARGVAYKWRRFRGRRDALVDVLGAVTEGFPVAMLIGERGIPRHWVLIVDADDDALQCYEPSSGRVIGVGVAAVREARITGLGFARPFALVLPTSVAVWPETMRPQT
ncbi:hypothetical protein ACRCUN_19205 [Mycobacterium sp. LTG2003]